MNFFAFHILLISVMIVCLNGYIFLIIVISKKINSACNFLLLHLGFVNILIGIILLIFHTPIIISSDRWFNMSIPCNFFGSVQSFLHSVVIWTICCLHCDRYFAITSPLQYTSLSMSFTKIAAIIMVIWIMCFLICVPQFFTFMSYTYKAGFIVCVPDFGIEKKHIWYDLAYSTLTLLLPTVLMIAFNVRILIIARSHQHKIASAIVEAALSAQITISRQIGSFCDAEKISKNNSNIKYHKKNAVWKIIEMIGSFVLVYYPYYVVLVWELVSSIIFPVLELSTREPNPYFVKLACWLLVSSPLINAFLYGIQNKTLQNTFRNYQRKHFLQNELNYEIQNRSISENHIAARNALNQSLHSTPNNDCCEIFVHLEDSSYGSMNIEDSDCDENGIYNFEMKKTIKPFVETKRHIQHSASLNFKYTFSTNNLKDFGDDYEEKMSLLSCPITNSSVYNQ